MLSQKASLPASREPEELKRLLTDAEGLFLQLSIPFIKEAQGYKIKCPQHEEKTASCSIRMGEDQTLSVKCFGCGFSGNVLHLIAASLGMNIKTDFPKIKMFASELATKTKALPSQQQENIQKPISKFSPKHYHLFATYLLEQYPASQDEEAKAYLEKRGVGLMASEWGCLPKDKTRLQLLRSQIIRHLGSSAWYQSGMAHKGEQVISWPTHRLLIPWTNPQGQIQALQRRVLANSPENEPKYVFPSTRFVPAVTYPFCRDWDFLKNEEKPIAICEGVFDALSFERIYHIPALGLPGVQSEIQGLAPFLKNRYVVLALDNDVAGKTKTESWISFFKQAGVKDVKRATPKHKDFNEDLMEMNKTNYIKK